MLELGTSNPESPKILPLWNETPKDHSNHVCFFLGGGPNSIIIVYREPLGKGALVLWRSGGTGKYELGLGSSAKDPRLRAWFDNSFSYGSKKHISQN